MQEILASSAVRIGDLTGLLYSASALVLHEPAIPTSFLSVITSDEDTFI